MAAPTSTCSIPASSSSAAARLLKDPGEVPVEDIRDYVDRSIEKEKSLLDAEREDARADQKRIADARKRTAQVAFAGLVIAVLVAAAAVWEYIGARQARSEAVGN